MSSHSSSHHRTISVHRVRAALRGAERLGIDTVPLLQHAHIPPLLLGDDGARVTPEQFAQLVRQLHTATEDEFLGLGPAPSRRGTFAMMCHACIGCPDLGSALRRGVRFYGLFPYGPDLRLDLLPAPGLPGGTGTGTGASPGTSTGTGTSTRTGTGTGAGALCCTVRSRFPDDPDHFLSECLLVIWHRLSSWLIGRRIPLLWAEFAYSAPRHHAEYAAMFGCPSRFGAEWTRAAIDARWLRAPVVQDDATLAALLRRSPADFLSRRAWDTTVAEQVRHTLLRALCEGARLPELAVVAAQLAVSQATLRRRLRAEGTSFQSLKDAVRRDAALASLAGGQEPIARLAVRLGFSEDAAFHRAFRRWTGTTPGAFRAGGSTERSAPHIERSGRSGGY